MSESSSSSKKVVLNEVMADLRQALNLARQFPDHLDPDYHERLEDLSFRLEVAFAIIRWDSMYAIATNTPLDTLHLKEFAKIRDSITIVANDMIERLSPDHGLEDDE